jgi:hypothetical protein
MGKFLAMRESNLGFWVGGMTFDVHGITGGIAIVLMFIHAGWAYIVLKKNNEKAIDNFHKFSVAVWVIWLVPFFSPMFFAMVGCWYRIGFLDSSLLLASLPAGSKDGSGFRNNFKTMVRLL